MNFTADLETTTDENDCRCWVWGVNLVGDRDYFTYGTTLDEFITYCMESNNSTYYFHNLKFDGEFLITRLFELGFKHKVCNSFRDKLDTREFSTLISDKGQWYTVKICFERDGKIVNQVTIKDSMKILPFSVSDIAKGFKLDYQKGEIDYDAHNGEIKPVTEEELDYLRRDVTIPALALETLFSEGLTALTTGSNALTDYKKRVTDKKFNKWFPELEYYVDKAIRKSYRGGWTYLNPQFRSVDIKRGFVLDVNSLYPSQMRNRPLPYGEPVYFEGSYSPDSIYSLYTQKFTCMFEIKPNKLPTIQMKNNLAFMPTDYLTSSNGEEVELCLTSVDLELFLDHYDVYNLEYIDGYKFKATTGLFTEYIDYWTEVKIQSKKDDNASMYILAKLMLNSLYGKLSLNPDVQSKIPYFENGRVKYRLGEKERRKGIYIPAGSFITSWARYTTITSAQKIMDAYENGTSDIQFVYADTDSLHCISPSGSIPDFLEIDDTALGAWKHESDFVRARFLRQKSYYETQIVSDKEFSKMEEEKQLKCYIYEGVRVIDNITVAGLSERGKKNVTWDNFYEGVTYEGNLKAKHVKGGIVLSDAPFEFRKKKKFDKKLRTR